MECADLEHAISSVLIYELYQDYPGFREQSIAVEL